MGMGTPDLENVESSVDSGDQAHPGCHKLTSSWRYGAHTEEHRTVSLMPSYLFPQRTAPVTILSLAFVCTSGHCMLHFALRKFCFPKQSPGKSKFTVSLCTIQVQSSDIFFQVVHICASTHESNPFLSCASPTPSTPSHQFSS